MSGRQKAALALGIVLLMWLPTGISMEDHTPIVTGHSTFYNASGYDQCLASLAGILRSRVMWFNDQVLVERYAGKGNYIMITEYGAPDPRARPALFTEGVYYDFTDPNGAQWHVEEAWFPGKIEGNPVSYSVDPNDAVGANVQLEPVPEENRYYVWFVELSANPIYDEFGDDIDVPHTYYNFLVLVDTCKLNKDRMDELADERDANPYYRDIEHTEGSLGPRNGHPNAEETHDHEQFIVDLWTSRKPETIPFGTMSSDPNTWQSSWAAQYSSAAEPSNEQSVPEGFEESLP